MYIFAVESSCDDLGLAIFDTKKPGIIADIVKMQHEIHACYGGIVPEIAAATHLQQLLPSLEYVIQQSGIQVHNIDVFAYTKGPGLIGSSYIGAGFCETLAYIYHKPLIGIHHLYGHMMAPACDMPLKYPHIALLVSGGHTDMYYLSSPYDIQIIGRTRDDALGEFLDKSAVALGLPYPGGPAIEEAACYGDPDVVKIPLPFPETFDFSFSGIKTFVYNYCRDNVMNKQVVSNIAATIQQVCFRVLIDKLAKAVQNFKVCCITISGGVSANKMLRTMIHQRFGASMQIYFPSHARSTDNAAMIACATSILVEQYPHLLQRRTARAPRVDPGYTLSNFFRDIRTHS